ncbi:MAG: flagellar motor switch protein FliG [Bacteroidetes bacterium]|nr:flagellar motor switch protein FliG [Bacteroidota bacterium]MCW5895114.1 flagellar motor switch protein FliG [Bacteroidota bacterium]
MRKDSSTPALGAKTQGNKQKAALLLLSLDLGTATTLMRTLTQAEIEDLTVEITRLKSVPSVETDKVMEEFQSLIKAQEYLVDGGADQARSLLEKSLGNERAAFTLDRVKAATTLRGFNNLKKADAYQVANFLQKEHPQTIALILSNLRLEQTAEVLSQIPPDLRNDVIFRMATLGKVAPSLIAEMEQALEAVAQTDMTSSMSALGGPKSVASVLNRVGTEKAKEIMEHLEIREPQLASEIKSLMFLFEDIIYVDDRGIQRVLREVDKKDLALALKVVDDQLKSKILTNMSERAQELLREELQYMGPVRLKEVEAAQARIIAVVKKLEETGEIIVAGRGGAEELVV